MKRYEPQVTLGHPVVSAHRSNSIRCDVQKLAIWVVPLLVGDAYQAIDAFECSSSFDPVLSLFRTTSIILDRVPKGIVVL